MSSEQLFRDACLRFLIIFFPLDSFNLEINKLEVFEKFIIVELFGRKKIFLASLKELLESCPMNYACNSGDRNKKL